MNKSVLRMIGVAGVTALAVVTLGQTAEANHPDPCVAVAADQTVTWNENESSIQSPMSGSTYGHGGCRGYVVDIKVTPATAIVGPSQTPPFSVGGLDPERESWGGITVANVPENLCAQWEETVSVYRKPAGEPTFAYVGGGISKGRWNAGFPMGCTPTREASFKGYGPFTPPKSGTDTYRVVYSANLGSAIAHAAAAGSHVPAPPR